MELVIGTILLAVGILILVQSIANRKWGWAALIGVALAIGISVGIYWMINFYIPEEDFSRSEWIAFDCSHPDAPGTPRLYMTKRLADDLEDGRPTQEQVIGQLGDGFSAEDCRVMEKECPSAECETCISYCLGSGCHGSEAHNCKFIIAFKGGRVSKAWIAW